MLPTAAWRFPLLCWVLCVCCCCGRRRGWRREGPDSFLLLLHPSPRSPFFSSLSSSFPMPLSNSGQTTKLLPPTLSLPLAPLSLHSSFTSGTRIKEQPDGASYPFWCIRMPRTPRGERGKLLSDVCLELPLARSPSCVIQLFFTVCLSVCLCV